MSTLPKTPQPQNQQPVFASNYPPEKGLQELSPLLKPNGGKWTLIESGKGIERSFKFSRFGRCWKFMNQIAPECMRLKHHPEWSNLYNTTLIRWTTHSPTGISEKDILMARFCDEKAKECEEIEEGKGKGKKEGVKERVGKVGEVGGDCYVPKTKI